MRKNEDLSGFLQKVKTVYNDIFTNFNFKNKKELKKLLPIILTRINELIRTIENSNQTLDSLLNECGLTDKQLEIKIKLFDEIYQQWLSNKSTTILRRLLKWLNLILGSIARAIPLCESIKEFKEMIELQINASKK